MGPEFSIAPAKTIKFKEAAQMLATLGADYPNFVPTLIGVPRK